MLQINVEASRLGRIMGMPEMEDMQMYNNLSKDMAWMLPNNRGETRSGKDCGSRHSESQGRSINNKTRSESRGREDYKRGRGDNRDDGYRGFGNSTSNHSQHDDRLGDRDYRKRSRSRDRRRDLKHESDQDRRRDDKRHKNREKDGDLRDELDKERRYNWGRSRDRSKDRRHHHRDRSRDRGERRRSRSRERHRDSHQRRQDSREPNARNPRHDLDSSQEDLRPSLPKTYDVRNVKSIMPKSSLPQTREEALGDRPGLGFQPSVSGEMRDIFNYFW